MSGQACSGNKRRRETNQVGDDDGVILRKTTERSETHHVINVTIDKAASSSPFRSNKLGRRDVQVIRRERPKSYPYSVGDHNVVGIEEDVQTLVQQLTNPQSGNFLAIVGMGGSGKTTLARKIYNHQEISGYFDRRAWICVSQVWSEESILKDIFSQTTQRNSNNLTLTEIVQEMRKLLGDKSYLVVLDDVWQPDALRKIMVPTCKPHGSKFVITTRNQKVIQFSDLYFEEHTPRRLTRDHSLELFCKIAFDHQNNTIMAHRDGPFVDLAKKMLNKCDGLPLAVISLAGLLRIKKTIQEWIKVSKNVSSKIIEDHVGPSDYGRVEDILGLSYSDLNHTMKSCFMYLSLFPEDAEISCGMLMRCWIAEGFVKSANESIEDVARQYLDELIQRCLVQVVRVNCSENAQTVRVHDLLRDLALKKAKLKYFSDTLPSNSSPRPIMQFLRLSINPISNRDRGKMLEDLGVCFNLNLTPTLNQDKVSRRLRSFIDLSYHHWLRIDLKTFFTNYSVLRVLILKYNEKDIPDAVGSLIHLRYLRLSFNYSDSTPYLPDSIQNLRNLLSFDCHSIGYRIKPMSLPNLKQMKQLRYLRLPRAFYDYGGPLHLPDLRKLKVVKGIKSGKWMMTELKYLSPTVEKLEIIDIENSKELEQVYECPSIVEDYLCSLRLNWEECGAEFELQKIQHCANLEKLYLYGEIATITGVPFVFPAYLLKLKLVRSEIGDQDSFAYALQRLTCLKFLKLFCNAYNGVGLTFPAKSLLKLEKLKLCALEELERVHVMEGAMPHLKSFIILDCFNLKVIQVMEGAMRHLKSFDGNCIDYIRVLLKIQTDEWMMKESKYLHAAVTKLGIIDIKNKKQLEEVYEFPSIVEDNLYGLKLKLDTYDAKFEVQKVQHCTQLRKLHLDGVIAATGAPFVFPPYLRKLELLRSRIGDQDSFADALQALHLEVLILAYDAYVGVHLTFPANSLLYLKKLQLYHLQELDRIHVMEGAMPHLDSFAIGHCKKLKVIPQRFCHLLRKINDGEKEDIFVFDAEDLYLESLL